MKTSFRIDDPNILVEAKPGDLFVPLGPQLVECACALRTPQAPRAGAGNVDAAIEVVVIACRVGKDEPEYYEPGHTAALDAATPIVFLEPVEALALRPRARRPVDEALAHELATHLVGLHSFPPRAVDITRTELTSRL